ncbi:MAG: metallopeptidase TldD-related protein [bacterium]
MTHYGLSTRVLRCVALASCMSLPARAQGQGQARDQVIVRAAQDELARTMKELRLAKADTSYFVAYTITEHEAAGASARFGSLVGSSRNRSRILRVEVRVGDYGFDNTNFAAMPSFTGAGMRAFIGMTELPLDDDYLEIRRQIWLATDAAYKQAVEGITGKRAALLNRARTDTLADFAKAQVTKTTDDMPPVKLDLAVAETLARDLSRAGIAPAVYAAAVSVGAVTSRTYYVNSEGTSWVKTRPMLTVSATASTQAGDGMPLGNAFRVMARSMSGLPSRDQLAARVKEMQATLDTVRNAPLVDRYNGPVLFEGRAAAELFSAQFAPAFVASRKALSSNPMMDQMSAMLGRSSPASSLAEKLGARVLPDFLNVVDDPTLTEVNHVAMLGGYKVDDQGVAAHPTRLVERGILRTFLAGRTPVEGVPHSTGNFREGVVAPSNLVVESLNGSSDAALRERLLALAKARGLPFAMIVRAVGDATSSDDPMAMFNEIMATMRPGSAPKGTSLFRVYKVFADGHEECVRGAQVLGLGADTFKGIVAASASVTALHASGGGTGMAAIIASAGGGAGLSTFVVPSLLFDELTINRRTDDLPKPPFSAPPVGSLRNGTATAAGPEAFR